MKKIEELQLYVDSRLDSVSAAEDPETELLNICEKIREYKSILQLYPRESWIPIYDKVWEVAVFNCPDKFYMQ